MTQGEKAGIIKVLRENGLQLKYLLKAMYMARSTYYFEISKKDVVTDRNKDLLKEIKSILTLISIDIVLDELIMS